MSPYAAEGQPRGIGHVILGPPEQTTLAAVRLFLSLPDARHFPATELSRQFGDVLS